MLTPDVGDSDLRPNGSLPPKFSSSPTTISANGQFEAESFTTNGAPPEGGEEAARLQEMSRTTRPSLSLLLFDKSSTPGTPTTPSDPNNPLAAADEESMEKYGRLVEKSPSEQGKLCRSAGGVDNALRVIAAPTSDDDSVCADIDRWASSSLEDSLSQTNESERLRELEAEQRRLNDAVLMLATNFAQIQFRVQQINMAPKENRDEMLRQLQEFASRGCVDIAQVQQETEELKSVERKSATINGTIGKNTGASGKTQTLEEEKKERVQQLIGQLRQQLEDLERFAYEQGHGEMPLGELRRKQKLVFDKLQEKMCFKIELDRWTEKELGTKVDANLEQILTPMKEKDELLEQLQTQIADLERFVTILQQECNSGAKGEEEPPTPTRNRSSTTPIMLETTPAMSPHAESIRSLESTFKRRRQHSLYTPGGTTNPQNSSPIWRLFGCRSQRFERNGLKHTVAGNHYGDQRAQVELAVDTVLQVLEKYQILTVDREDGNVEGAEEGSPLPTNLAVLNSDSVFARSEEPIVSVVRKEFAPALKALLEHGLRARYQPLPKGLGRMRSDLWPPATKAYPRPGQQITHIWDVMLYFYECSKWSEKQAALGTLTHAYKLDSIDGRAATSKQILLATIEHIATTHLKHKRSMDSMWKAFVSAALNQRRLPGWVRIIFRSEFIVNNCYCSWSYVARTGCEELRPLLERMHAYNFDLPVDLACRPFEHIREAF